MRHSPRSLLFLRVELLWYRYTAEPSGICSYVWGLSDISKFDQK